jgi:cytochrome P450
MRTTEGGYTDGSLLVYRNEDIKSLVGNPELGNQPIDVYSRQYRGHGEVDPPGFEQLMENSLFTMHPPFHGPARQLVSRQLTTKSVARFADAVEQLVRGLIDEAAERGEVDFRRDVANRVMAGFWSFALGWTQAEADEACALAARSQLSNLFNPTPEERREINQASLDLLHLLRRTLARQLDAGTHDLLRGLIADYEAMDDNEPGRPDVLEAVFGVSLLDGLHSLGGVIASVVHALLSAPDCLSAVRANRALVPAAFLEGVRLHPAVTLTQRHALNELVIHDVDVPQGTPVTMAWLLGNRDPAAFDDPNVFRLDRIQRPQTTFGGGFYICPGRNIVRFLSEIVLTEVTSPSVEIEPTGAAEWKPATGLHELDRMPVGVRRVAS